MTATMTRTPPAISLPAAEPAAEGLSDEALAARVQGGCVKSYEQLDRRYRLRLIHLLRRRVGREADAEDLAQVTLWTAYEKIGRYDPQRRFSTWLFTIAVRKAIDHGRAMSRRGGNDRAVAGGMTSGGDATVALADDKPGPMQRAIDAEQHERAAAGARAGAGAVWRVADRVLTPRQWTALWLAYGEDQTPSEIARAMNITRVNVRVLLHRARKVMAKELADHGEVTDTKEVSP